MTESLRNLSRALIVATVLSLLIDAVMRPAYFAIQAGAMPDWWSSPSIIQRIAAIAAAVLLFLTTNFWGERIAQFVPNDDQLRLSRRPAFVIVALAMIAWPCIWFVAGWVAGAIRMVILGDGASASAFISSGYYASILLEYAPPILAGCAMLAWSKHLTD